MNVRTKKRPRKEIELGVGKIEYGWLAERSNAMGFNRVKRVGGSNRPESFEELYLRGRFGRQNAVQIKKFLNIAKNKEAGRADKPRGRDS